MANQSINLNLIPSGIAEVARVSQFDVGRIIEFNLYHGSDPYISASGLEIEVHGMKADKNIFIYTSSDGSGAVSISGSTITLKTTLQMTAASGETLLQFRLKRDGDDAGTLNCIMYVQEDPASEGDISESELPAIISQATDQMERAEAAATSAGQSATAAATSATTAGTAASNAAEAATRAEAAASVAEAADLNPPYIGQNGNWYTFDLTTRQYKDTGIAARGDTGATGNGIQNIQKTGTSGLVDSYRINYTNGSHFDYTVTNGKDGAGGVSSVNNVAPVQGNVTLTKSNIGLGNVDNTADANKSVNYATSAGSAGSATSATRATQDQSGNNIKSTYGASLSLSNNVLSLVNKNGSTLSSQTLPSSGLTSTVIVNRKQINVSGDYREEFRLDTAPKTYKLFVLFVVNGNGQSLVFPTDVLPTDGSYIGMYNTTSLMNSGNEIKCVISLTLRDLSSYGYAVVETSLTRAGTTQPSWGWYTLIAYK